MPYASVAIAPEQRSAAVLTHLSGLAGYLVPFCGVIVPLIIWMVKSDSPVISSIAKQAVFLNLAAWLLAGGAALLLLRLRFLVRAGGGGVGAPGGGGGEGVRGGVLQVPRGGGGALIGTGTNKN